MSTVDWVVLFGTLAFFVGYGVWRGRGERNLSDFLLAGRSMPWGMVALSVMATQASAVTFLATPGQGFTDGLRFVQFYFGLPLAMIVICVLAIPIYHRLKVFTAYEYLEQRFDGKTRSLAAALFLIQRGLAAGITIYAPSLVLSVVLGWELRTTCALIGGLVVIYTVTGGSKAVSHTQALQFSIILGTMTVAFVLIARALPSGVSLGDAASLAGVLGRLNALETRFDPNDRYNLWSGLLGGFFLQLSYFGTDQSQVGRYLTGASVTQSRLGLLFNGLMKIPMQFAILSLGVLIFAFYLFAPPPLHFDPVGRARIANGPTAPAYEALEVRHRESWQARRASAEAVLAARHAGDASAVARSQVELRDRQAALTEVQKDKVALIKSHDPRAATSDTNYVFLTFVLANLPVGLIGLVFAAVFAASMNSTAAELSALTSTTVVDVLKRITGRARRTGAAVVEGITSSGSAATGALEAGRRDVWTARAVTVGWALFAVGFADAASRLGSLIEAVNILGSLFYGTILGIFMTAFLLRSVRGTAVFVAALIAEAMILACFRFTAISFLWYNLIGCVAVMIVAWLIQRLLDARAPRATA
ncbi:MAG: sodium:solute symporter, partial [Candidatus Eisenbacteria bacterium]|nr:sodium:solute symporter [Candidatus Eisenbacteria bacterium]